MPLLLHLTSWLALGGCPYHIKSQHQRPNDPNALVSVQASQARPVQYNT